VIKVSNTLCCQVYKLSGGQVAKFTGLQVFRLSRFQVGKFSGLQVVGAKRRSREERIGRSANLAP